MNNDKLALIRQFSAKITTHFDVNSLTVYNQFEKIYGDTIDCVLLERYLSLSCTTIFKEDKNSSLVSHINYESKLYVFIFKSKNADAFDGVEPQYIIDELKALVRKLGEVN